MAYLGDLIRALAKNPVATHDGLRKGAFIERAKRLGMAGPTIWAIGAVTWLSIKSRAHAPPGTGHTRFIIAPIQDAFNLPIYSSKNYTFSVSSK